MIGTVRISQLPLASPLDGSENFIVNQNGVTRLSSLNDVVGIVSFVQNSGIATYADVSGISTFSVNSGIATYADVSGISTFSVNSGIASVSGISTLSEGLIGSPNISVGIITATSLTVSGIISANNGFNLGISSVGVAVTTGPVKTLNFIGAGNTFSVDGATVNISVSGSTNISYASTTRTLSSSTGIGTELPLVTSTNPGLMRPVDLGDVIVLVCSDETTDLTTGTTKARVKLPFAYTLTAVKADVNESDPPTGSGLVVDINEAGTSVLSTKLSIDANESTSDTAAAPAVISDAALARNAEITIDIDQVGSTNPGKGLKVALYVTRVQA